MQYQINGNQILLGNPTDTSYGQTPSNINVPNISASDKLPDAIDKIVGILDKLAPAKSPNLGTKFLSHQGSFFSARHVAGTTSIPGNFVWSSTSTQSAVTGSIYSFIIFGTNSLARVADGTASNLGYATFADGQSGMLYAQIDYSTVGTKVLDSTYYTTASASSSLDVGTFGALSIVFDGDPYNSPPNQGFWTSLKAHMTSTQSFAFDGQEHVYQILHTLTNNTNTMNFICDNGDGTHPTGLTGNPFFVVTTQSSTRYISGVPSLSVGDFISASYSVPNTLVGNKWNLISRFYNSTRISQFILTASSSNTRNDLNTNGIPVIGGTSAIPYANQPIWSVNGLTVSVISGMFATNSRFSFTTFNPKGDPSTVNNYGISTFGAPTGSSIYIDTVSNETLRVRSGDGQYPSFGSGVTQFGDTWSNILSSFSIKGDYATLSGEMMLQNAQFRYPQGDYDMNWPVAGPTYSNLITTSNYLNYRWATFKSSSSISNASSVTVQIIGATGQTNNSNPIEPKMLMYLTVVSGGTQSIGWLDANSAYVPGNNPSSNGDPAVSGGNFSSRTVTFGTITRTGDVYVRIGFTASSGIRFNNISIT